MSTITAGNVTVSCSLSADTTGNLVFQSGGNVTAMTIDTSQNVGIGTSSPSSFSSRTLQVTGSGTDVAVKLTNSTTGSGNSSGFDFELNGNDINYVNRTASGVQKFWTNSTERARIDSSGNLLVGTTTETVNPGVSIIPSGRINIGRSNDDAVAEFYRSGTRVGQINVTTTATSYITSSDYRLKENVAPMTGALAKVAALKPCTYTWKATGETDEGFIAHELAEVCPSAVTGEKDAVNEDGSIKPQGIDTSFLVATLTAAIQELKAELDATKAEVAALKGASA